MNNKTLDIIAPLYNEAENVEAFYRQVVQVWENHFKHFKNRLILIDDGSTDTTFELAKKLHTKDERVVVLKFAKNFGHHIAITAGLDFASAQYCVLMDSDLQDQASNIPLLLDKLTQKTPLVYSIRTHKTGSFFKRSTSSFFWIWIRFASGLDIPKNQAMLRLFDNSVLQALKKYPKTVPFYGGIFAHLGVNYATVNVVQHKRNAGESKYNFKRLLNLFSVATFGFGFRFYRFLRIITLALGFVLPWLILQQAFLSLAVVLCLLTVNFYLQWKCRYYQILKPTIDYEIEVILAKN